MKYEIIQSGSAGNATLINDCILVDCGVSFRKIEPYERGLRLVLLTHQHGDHFKPGTISKLAKDRPRLRFGCCEWMVPLLLQCGVNAENIDVYTIDGETRYYYKAQDLSIQPVLLEHNVPNCGYHIFIGDERLFYATDTGTLDGIEAKGYDIYLVEANHKEADLEARVEEKLAAGEFAYETAAAQNHLSYEQTVEWLSQNMSQNSIWVPMHQHRDKENRDGKQDHQGISVHE